MSVEDTPNQTALLDVIAKWIRLHVDSFSSNPHAEESIRRTLLAHLDIQWDEPLPPPPDRSDLERKRGMLASTYFGLQTALRNVEQVEFYFRRYPFHDLPVSKGEHLANCCEMLFDRINQYRDRAKSLTKSIQKVSGERDPRFGRSIRLINDIFRWELRQRNFVHHHGRFEYDVINQLNMVELLRYSNDLQMLPDRTRVYRVETRKWVKRTRQTRSTLEQITELLSGFVLESAIWDEFR